MAQQTMHALDVARAAGLEMLEHNSPPIRIANDELPEAFVRWLGPGYRFEVFRRYQVIARDVLVDVPAGFIFDAASVPRLFWLGIAPTELGVVAPLVHDWLYRTGGQYGRLTRGEADRIFLDHMATEGVSRLKRWAAYLAVRAAGGGSWRGGMREWAPLREAPAT